MAGGSDNTDKDDCGKRSPERNATLADDLLGRLFEQHAEICVGGKSELTYNINRDGELDNAHVDDWLEVDFDKARTIARELVARRRKSKRHGQVKVCIEYDANGQPKTVLLRDLSILS